MNAVSPFGFAELYMGVKPTLNFFYASLCILGAVFFIFRDLPNA